jgi:hypothetical protein
MSALGGIDSNGGVLTRKIGGANRSSLYIYCTYIHEYLGGIKGFVKKRKQIKRNNMKHESRASILWRSSPPLPERLGE